MTRGPRHFGRIQLGIERMEDRLLMAFGVVTDVQVNVAGGDLILTGDNGANAVEIRPISSTTYQLIGKVHEGARTYLMVNGHRYSSLNVSGVTDDFHIDLNGGNDYLKILGTSSNPLVVPDDLNITTGDGDDSIRVWGTAVHDTLVQGELHVDSGNHNDFVMFHMLQVNSDVTVHTGNGADTVSVAHSDVAGLSIHTGTDSGADDVLVGGRVRDHLSIHTFGGDDEVQTNALTVDDGLTIDTGAGSDTVELIYTTVDELFAALGSADDRLALHYVQSRQATLNGGSSSGDELFVLNSNLGSSSISGFEL